MNKDVLKKYAEAGVRERLREIQREIEVLARDFPHLVQNADGSLPVVMALEPKARPSANGHGGARYSFRAHSDALVAYLAAHPGTRTKDLAEVIGMTYPTSGFRTFLTKIARSKKVGKGGKTATSVWTLKR